MTAGGPPTPLPDYVAEAIADLRREVATMQAEIALLERYHALPRPQPAPPKRDGCGHPVAADHQAGQDADGRAVWVCSARGARDVWGGDWMWYGSLECLRCARVVVDRVWCPACRPEGAPVDETTNPRQEDETR